MRPICTLSAGVTLLLVASGMGWAGEKSTDTAKNKETTSAAFNKQFQWEEGVVGPKTKGIDHEKIAAMREEGRRQDAAKRREQMSGHVAKTERPEGVNGPASAKLPTMDIEKAAPAGSIRTGSVKKASYTPPRQHDEIDDALAENRGSADDGLSGQAGLNGLLSGRPSVRSSSHSTKTSHASAKHAKAKTHGRRRR